MPIGSKHTALCSADVHSNQTDVARNEQAEAAAQGKGVTVTAQRSAAIRDRTPAGSAGLQQ
jgi:hypothetical protein